MTLTYSANLPQHRYKAEQVRENEAIVANKQSIEMFELMQRAGAGVFDLIQDKFAHLVMSEPAKAKMTVFCGYGNNGGDGYIIARLAKDAGWSVVLIQVGEGSKLTGDAAKARDLYLKAGGLVVSADDVKLSQLANNTLVVDALLGTGINQAVRGKFAQLIDWINHQQHLAVCSVDLPSGLDANTGTVLGCAVQADFCCTFVAVKQGLSTGSGPDLCGQLYFSGLGIDQAFATEVTPSVYCLEQQDIKRLLPPRAKASHKGSHGHVLLLGGNAGMSGAIRLAGMACLRAGAGLVSVLTHPESSQIVASGCAELMVHSAPIHTDLRPWLERADVIAIGPGLGKDEWGKWLLAQTLAYLSGSPKKTLLDADGLNLIALQRQSFLDCGLTPELAVITPHPLEAARLLDWDTKQIQQDRFAAATSLCENYNVVSLVKGVGSVIYGQAHCYLNTTGTPAMATAGMGDVLSGIIPALMAQGLTALQSAALGAYIHGGAGELAAEDGQRGTIASDLLPHIRTMVNR